jgi:serine phosphatase RsbU (regulator of sigma subunit)
VLPTPDGGCWIGIGDVAGHGVTSGLVMLMVQSGISAMLEHNPHFAPHEVLRAVNTFLQDNIRERLGMDRVAAELHRKAGASTTEIRDALFELVLQWSPQPEDDVTLLVMRYLGEAHRAAA